MKGNFYENERVALFIVLSRTITSFPILSLNVSSHKSLILRYIFGF